MQIRSILIFLAFFPIFLSAQLIEKFDQGIESLSNWSGDLEDFTVNDEEQLQLDASENGTSEIYKLYNNINYSEPVVWLFYFKLDFAPSNSNLLRIYLNADRAPLSESSGYFLEIGESGSDDNLKFYRQVNGEELLLGEGTMGTLGDQPALAWLKVQKNPDGIWSFFTSYEESPIITLLEFELFDDELVPENSYFGFYCKYTETRKDKFFFDNIVQGVSSEDVSPPSLISASFIDNNRIRLIFNEILSSTSALDPSTFLIDTDIGNPTNISFGEFENEVILDIFPAAASGVNYVLTIDRLEDLSGNQLTTDIDLILTSKPSRGNLVINEILFDPYPGGSDFIELYNTSEQFLSLKGLVIQNLDNNRQVEISKDILINPKQYLAFTTDVDAINSDYIVLEPDNIIEHALPPWNNASGNVSLTFEGASVPLDSYDYSEDLHSVWIDDTEGVSLERIDPRVDTEQSDNWQSASEKSGFATPGYVNSNFSETTFENNEFFIEKKTFSPDGDGFDDFLAVKYRVTTAGFVLNMRVFDDRGQLVSTLATNEILGKEGSVIWDGTRDDGSLGKMGIYVIWIEYFDSQGSISYKKLSCVLAKQLN